MAKLPSGVYLSGQGPAVVFLHSSLSTARQWGPLTKVLSEKFTCINIDILGYGNAEKVTDKAAYDFSVELQRIRRILTECLDEQAYHLVGHSCGGAIALKLAVENPKKVLSLSLYEPVAFHLLPEGTEERAQSDSFASKIANLSSEQAAQVFTDFWNSEGFYLSLPTKLQTMMAADMEKVSLDFKGLISEKYQLKDLTAITCPSAIYSGSQSPHLSQFLAQEIADRLPNGHLIVMDAGHMGPINQADLVLPKMAEFIIDAQQKF
ncbi:alpha/beta fold hydrolase [Thalassotalea piscium]